MKLPPPLWMKSVLSALPAFWVPALVLVTMPGESVAAQASTRPMPAQQAEPESRASHQTQTTLRTYQIGNLESDTLLATLRELQLVAKIEQGNAHSIVVQAAPAEHAKIAAVLADLTAAPADIGRIKPIGGQVAGQDAVAAALADVLQGTAVTAPARPFSFSPSTASAHEKWLHEVLERPCPELDFPGETPLTEVLDHIAEFASSEYPDGAGQKRRLHFLPDLAELSEEGVELLEDISVTDIHIRDTTIESALNLIFEQTTEPRLELIIHNESALVTTHWLINNHRYLQTRVHDVGDLLRQKFAPAGRKKNKRKKRSSEMFHGPLPNTGGFGSGGFGSGGGQFSVSPQLLGESPTHVLPTEPQHPLCALIVEMTFPPYMWQQIDGEGGSLRLVDDTLIIRQGHACQREIVRLLNRLSRSSHAAHSHTAVFQRYGPDATPRERWLHELMDAPCGTLDFPGETPLAEVLEKIAAQLSERRPSDDRSGRLQFTPDFHELELEGIQSLDDVLVRDIYLDGVSVENALRVVFEQTQEPALIWVIENETLLVTTENRESELLQLRTYNVASVNQRLFADDPDGLTDTIQAMTWPPALWINIDGDGGNIRLAGDSLVIMQSYHVHQQIVRLLNQLQNSTMD
ncbi:MAG: hypothetical protein NXI04_01375 [Planctomycetaceae bacterium]|nr:hypothetical protein [Planctomycetaceae bacterium]